MLEKRNSRLETYLANQKNSHAILQFQKLNHRIKTWINKLLLNTIQTQQDEREFQDINTRYFQNQLTSEEFQTLKKHPNILYLLKLPDIFTHTIDYSMTELKQILIKNILHDQTEKIYSEIPKNKEFIERMTAKGLQLNPWLHGIPNFTIDVDGQEVSIELITDPLEVIQMGNYVEKSCFNINGGREIMPLAYALSANIQVLYAKCNNKVMARTTILINKDGNIVNLKHYSAQGTLGQKISFDSFIKELQKQIGCKEVLHSDIRDNIDKLIFSHIHFDNMTA